MMPTATRSDTAVVDPAIEVRGVSRVFGSRTVLEDVSFSVAAGSVTGFLGPNGAGKSSTMRIIVGLDRPTRGTAHIGGAPYADLERPGRAVGVLLDSSGFNPGRSARDHLMILADLIGADASRVEAVLDEVDLRSTEDRRVGEYSLGMTRRLGLASALLGEPDILILDEPSNGLDPAGIRWLRGQLQGFAARGGTVFVSSHVLGEIAQTAQQVIVIDQGRIVADTTVESLTGGGVIVVRSPQIEQLSGALRARGATVEQPGGDVLEVVGLTQDAVGHAAFDARVPVLELSTRPHTLEESFLSLTANGDHHVAS